ncbi:MAG: CPBP family intramembrane metalloprotease [Anaerolineae bacterium]|nr:CPBP family intramembrane metalloprotease [Anaerolineae bacterium]
MTVKSLSSNRFLLLVAWIIMLVVSILPNVLLHELAGGNPAWLSWAKIGLLVVLSAVAFFWKPLRPLRNFLLLLLAIFVTELLVSQLTGSILWQGWFGGADAPFTSNMLGTQLGRLIVSLLMIGVLLLLGYRRADFFLTRGQLDAPIAPVRWLGFPKPDPWTNFGGQFALYISLGTLLFLVLGGRPSPAAFLGVLPMLPAVLLFAALNAFNEEITYRASLLAGLEHVIGPQQALWLTAVFFGIGHYFGVPYGVIGVIMASFLGWMMGKAMLETRGLFWAWFIHFLQDVLIFSFMAIGSITPGG